MKILSRFMGYVLRYKWRWAGAHVLSSADVVSAIVIPMVIGRTVDQALAGGLTDQRLIMAGGIVLALGLFKAVVNYGGHYLSQSVFNLALRDLRNDFFHKLLRLSPGFYDRERTGDLMSRARIVEGPLNYFSEGLSQLVSMVALLGAMIGLMLATNWRLGLIGLAVVTAFMWLAMLRLRRLRETWARVDAEFGNMISALHESLVGMRVVKAFGAGGYEESKFEERASSVADLSYSAGWFWAIRGSMFALMSTMATGVILVFGGREVVSGRLTAGELVTFMMYMGLLTFPITWGAFRILQLTREISSGQRVVHVLDAESPVRESPRAMPMPRVRGHVRFEGVSLVYEGGAEAVHDIDFEVQPGRLVAILGAPGSGKSTIVHLIPRFYDVSAGRVTIDGVDVRDAGLTSLRENVGIVLQDTFAFSATLRDNIAYGAEGTTMDEVVRAAKVAQFHDFVESLPAGYDTWVGERGITLSGGQRQRLTIARTILMNPPILILDDSTSSVDVGTEYEIQRALAEVIKDRTTFVIAHRLSTVRKADLILVLDGGEIAERGTHQELLTRDGFYRHIYDLQLGGQQWEELPALEAEKAPGGDT